MRRFDLLEIHDHPAFPAPLRDLVTDALQALWRFGNSYQPIVPRLNRILKETNSATVLDLCSGGGGPWPSLAPQLQRDHGTVVHVRLSDKYPNLEAFQQAAAKAHTSIGSVQGSVDASCVSPSLTGFRTMFSSLHHFNPAQVKSILRSAIERNQGIAIFELAQRNPLTLATLFVTPFLVLWLTPRIRPFRWSRLLWTYLLPVVPFVVWFDGLVSCLRAYAPEELSEMIADVKRSSPNTGHQWQLGEERGGLLPVTYLIASLPSPAI